MKKYMAPELEMMDFIVDKSVIANLGSIFNDGDFGNNWPDNA